MATIASSISGTASPTRLSNIESKLMKHLTKKKINQLIDERKKVYQISNEAVSAYQRENELAKEYNGRQILEMIQNADDAKATEMLIKIDKQKKMLSIYNNGDSFSYEGIRSILIANLSAKTSSSYIGNKGLGFRSLLVWADEIEIQTKGFSFKFSEKIAKTCAENLDHNLSKMARNYGYAETTCLFPVLGIPEIVSLVKPIQQGCTININYKEKYEADIIKQLDLLEEQTLLFLNKINKIVKNIDGDDKTLEIERLGNKHVKADGIEWKIVERSNDLPDDYQDVRKQERKKYSIKLAFPMDGCSQSYRLYNYLPTQEEISLPYIIHATLNLDSSRNHINNDDTNRYILEQVAELIGQCCDEKLKVSGVSNWEPYKMISPVVQSSSTIVNECLYEPLKVQREKKCIFPTLGGTYVNKDSYYYKDNECSDFWQDFVFEGCDDLCKILKSAPLQYVNTIEEKAMPSQSYRQDINKVAEGTLSIEYRARIINFLVRHSEWLKDCDEPDLHLFVDDKNNVVNDASLFTPKTPGVDYALPEFVNIKFINGELYRQLLELIKDDYLSTTEKEEKNSTSTARLFCTLLKDKKIVTRLFDYDKSQVLTTIVSHTNKKLDNCGESESEKASVVQAMVNSLFTIYTSSESFETRLKEVKLLNTRGMVCKASELCFNDDVNRQIFGHEADVYCQKLEDLETEGNSEEMRHAFLRQLGVNQFIVEEELPDDAFWRYAQWLEQIKEIKGGEPPYNKDCLYKTKKGITFKRLNETFLSLIEKLSLNQICLLLASSDELYNHVVNPDSELQFLHSRKFFSSTKYSYLRYQLLNLDSVKNKILSDEVVLDDKFIRSESIDKNRYSEVLKFLTTNLRGVSEDEVATLINDLAERKYSVCNIRKVYKIIIDTLSLDGRKLENKDIKLCATDSTGNTGYYPIDQVYYTNNSVLPKSFIEARGLKRLYYPLRQGADKVCKVFGIKPVMDITPEIDNKSIEKIELSDNFEKYFSELKPLILLYCIQDVDSKETKRTIANRLKASKIILVKKCQFHYEKENSPFNLEKAEFVHDGNDTYYVNASDISSLDDMKSSVPYCKVVTEILSIISKLEGKGDTFIRIFQNLKFMESVAKSEFPKSDIEEAHALLGLSAEEIKFWSNVLQTQEGIASWSETDIYDKFLELADINEKVFSYSNFCKVDYTCWMNSESVKLLELLKEKLKNNNFLQVIDLSALHAKMFENAKKDYKSKFVSCLWLKLSNENEEKQREFINIQHRYDKLQYIDLNKNKFYTIAEYNDSLKKLIYKEYGIDLSGEGDVSMPEIKYPKFISIMNELTAEERSLFYFSGYEKKIEEFAELQKSEAEKSTESKDSKANGTLTIVDQLNESPISVPNRNKKTGGQGRTHSEKMNRQKKQAGKNSEILVKELLKKSGYEYHWRSGYSDEPDADDTLGYDFEYKLSSGSEWRFLEVKSFSGQSFILSGHEFEISQDSEHKGRYDIALVKDENVFIVKNFFETNHQRVANDYIVYCSINQSNNDE